MKVLLHIGSPKAGSTTIQNALSLNADALAARNVLTWQPDASKGPPARVLSNRFAPDERPLLPRERLHFRTRAETIDWSLENWRRLSELVRRQKPALTVLSSESLFAVRKANRVLEALYETFDEVTILAYIRDPAEQYKSSLDQIIRDGARFADLPLPTRFHFPPHNAIRGYHDALGKDRVIVRNLDRRNLDGGDLVSDVFGHIARLSGQALDTPVAPPRANESLCAAATVWLLGVNETFSRFSDGGDREQVKRRLELVRRLIRSKPLSGLPKLTLGDGDIALWARHAERPAIEYYNTVFFHDQVPLTPAPADTILPAEADMRRTLRRWLLDQVNGDHMPIVLREAIPTV
ncbi:MAG: hypothetical protein HLUCCA12_07760 [Rhodobacteraceae bacterium HLUCCA12]|nr:MAG: hypothetical protein HLUCCA12_07760 [Rhodobacteraceae bacterium HLUCCA12]